MADQRSLRELHAAAFAQHVAEAPQQSRLQGVFGEVEQLLDRTLGEQRRIGVDSVVGFKGRRHPLQRRTALTGPRVVRLADHPGLLRANQAKRDDEPPVGCDGVRGEAQRPKVDAAGRAPARRQTDRLVHAATPRPDVVLGLGQQFGQLHPLDPDVVGVKDRQSGGHHERRGGAEPRRHRDVGAHESVESVEHAEAPR